MRRQLPRCTSVNVACGPLLNIGDACHRKSILDGGVTRALGPEQLAIASRDCMISAGVSGGFQASTTWRARLPQHDRTVDLEVEREGERDCVSDEAPRSPRLRPMLRDPLVADGAEVVRRSFRAQKSRHRDEHHDERHG
jgi:hypothetical protein